MDILHQLQLWAKGDATQGKVMLIAGVILAIAVILMIMNGNTMQKGMLIPLGLLLILNFGYGGFLTLTRTDHAKKVEELHAANAQEAVSQELAKAEKDSKTYGLVKPVWGGLMVVGVAMFFFFSGDYWKGLSLGILVLCTAGLIIDTFLHHRLEPYLEALRTANGG